MPFLTAPAEGEGATQKRKRSSTDKGKSVKRKRGSTEKGKSVKRKRGSTEKDKSVKHKRGSADKDNGAAIECTTTQSPPPMNAEEFTFIVAPPRFGALTAEDCREHRLRNVHS
jgi:hypothetical protein